MSSEVDRKRNFVSKKASNEIYREKRDLQCRSLTIFLYLYRFSRKSPKFASNHIKLNLHRSEYAERDFAKSHPVQRTSVAVRSIRKGERAPRAEVYDGT